MAWTHHFHIAQAVVDALGNVLRQRLIVQIQNLMRQLRVNRNHRAGQVLGQGQNRQSTTVVEAFKRGVFIARRVLKTQRNHGAAKIVHINRNAHLLARGGETRIRRHDQRGSQFFTRGQNDVRLLRRRTDGLYLLLGEPSQIRLMLNL